MPDLYKIADTMLVTLENKAYDAGKSIIGAINGSCANFIINNKIGYACASNDAHALANIINNLDLKELHTIGEHSKDVYFRNITKVFL